MIFALLKPEQIRTPERRLGMTFRIQRTVGHNCISKFWTQWVVFRLDSTDSRWVVFRVTKCWYVKYTVSVVAPVDGLLHLSQSISVTFFALHRASPKIKINIDMHILADPISSWKKKYCKMIPVEHRARLLQTSSSYCTITSLCSWFWIRSVYWTLVFYVYREVKIVGALHKSAQKGSQGS